MLFLGLWLLVTCSLGPTKEKKEDAEKNESVEMSKNAQFRAIKPSPSVLSFVEDNVMSLRKAFSILAARSYISYLYVVCSFFFLFNGFWQFHLQFLGRRRLIELRRAGYNTEFSAPLDI